jgi:ABC-type multidrug transport system ATPase subunit
VRQLSCGEKRGLDLALALLGRPDVLFLDEPTTGMDPEVRTATLEDLFLRLPGSTRLEDPAHSRSAR